MKTWIALLRGVNVGGKTTVPMSQLKQGLEAIGFRNVQTYIQSGNVVFESKGTAGGPLAKKIANYVETANGFLPSVLVISPEQLASAIKANPFPQGEEQPATLHFYFLEKLARTPQLHALTELKRPTEKFQLIDSVLYLYAPEGVGRSKLAQSVERALGVATTARNYRTVKKLQFLADSH